MAATVQIRRLVIENDQHHRILLLEIDIDCESCGTTQGVIHGHHLATLHKALGMVIAEHPELCGTVGDLTDQLQFEGVSDPRKATLN